jgi:hypothetical protein
MATTPITAEPGREPVLLDLERCNEEKIVAKIRAKKSDGENKHLALVRTVMVKARVESNAAEVERTKH